MTLWIRIDANIGENPKVWELAALRGVSAEACVGLLVILFGKVAEHAPSGDVAQVPDPLLERWAGWSGEPGAFARDFRALFASAGVIDGWAERQGKLIERANKERERWQRRNSAEKRAELRGDSAEESAARNVTVRNKRKEIPRRAAEGGGSGFDLAPYIDAHRAVFPDSDPPAGRFGRTFKRLEAKHGPAETLRRWQVCLAAKREFATPEELAAHWSLYADPPAPRGPSAVDEMTRTYGEWFTEALPKVAA